MMLRTALLGGSLLLCSPLAAQTAQRAPSPDAAVLASCLGTSGNSTEACIGSIAIACVRAAGGDPRGAEAGCARREEGFWRERLNLALQLTARPLDAGQRSRLAALQMTWESYVAQKCALYGSSQREPLQAGRQAGCQLREVAERAIELARALPRTGARAPAPRPEILR